MTPLVLLDHASYETKSLPSGHPGRVGTISSLNQPRRAKHGQITEVDVSGLPSTSPSASQLDVLDAMDNCDDEAGAETMVEFFSPVTAWINLCWGRGAGLPGNEC